MNPSENSPAKALDPTASIGIMGKSAIVGLTFMAWVLIRAPLSNYLEFWFWEQTLEPRPAWWLIMPMLAVAFGGVFMISRFKFRNWKKLLVLVIVGFVLQHGFALMESRGLQGMKDRMLDSGHSRFASQAVMIPDMFWVAARYQILIESGDLDEYPYATKPPGQLLFYMVTDRLSRILPWDEADPMGRIVTFSAFLWPLLAGLCVFPIYLLARLFLDEEKSFIPCILFVTTPSFVLINLHLDQCLYPFLFTAAVAAFIYGLKLGRTSLLIFSGVITGGSLFISFSLVVLPAFLMLLLLVHFVYSLRFGARSPSLWKDTVLYSTAYIAGMLIPQGLFFLVLNYDVVSSFQLSMEEHRSFKIMRWTPFAYFYFGFLNILEFILWTGMPVISLATIYILRSRRRLRATDYLSALLAMTFVPMLLGMAFLGKTAAETARLWIFLLPLVSCFAGIECVAAFPRRLWMGTSAIVALQLLSVLAFKLWQDFA